METCKYKYISFILIAEKAKTKVYKCINNNSGDELAIIKWYPPWRQYCFFPSCSAVYNKGCMQDIVSFIERIDAERRSG
jgi:hypothetical protein